jgi:2-oxoglutarate dehydrogenase E1 component
MSTAVSAIPPSINGWNAEYLEDQYARFKADPESIPADLRAFLQGFDLAHARGAGTPSGGAAAPGGGGTREALRSHAGVVSLVDAYRRYGHMSAKLDPFGRPRQRPAVLELDRHGLSQADLDRPAPGHGLPINPGATLREVVAFLERAYCGSVGVQFMHLQREEHRAWWVQKFEAQAAGGGLAREEKLRALELIVRAEQFEKFLQKRYPGDKRFSLEGGEALIPILDRMIRAAAETGCEEIVLGMPHRGRLNVLNNVVGKSYEQIFTEFEDNFDDGFADGGGDVKYHKGYSGERLLPGGKKLHLAMASNPSHLESVNAVVAGRVRAKQRIRNDIVGRRRVMPLLMHGDAAVIGQGVTFEVLNMAQLPGYTVGGTVHVVVNNLIGFTTLPEDSRGGPYCTDGALGFDVPVLHVSGMDPEACVATASLAVEFRQAFGRDVFVDMWCFRKYGHNEQDEASFTQPLLAELIRAHAGVASGYAQHLVEAGVVTAPELERIRATLDAALEKAQAAAKSNPHDPTIDPAGKRWSGMGGEYSHAPASTAVSPEVLREVCGAMGRVPEGFEVNPKLKKLLGERAALGEAIGGKDAPGAVVLAHAEAEQLAVGTLLLEGTAVRISGQDCRRGTFSQRHAVLRDYKTGAEFTPLNAMRPVAESPDDANKPGPDGRRTQARYCVHDSPLSEFGVMGFDYGYSLGDPNMLVCWEGQFGDFVNGAQVLIDQYLASAEIKWRRWSGLVLLLPHGYEGAGPEHSSGRLERFLQLCADDNMQVVYPSTGAQIFHLLRRQVRRGFRKPLVVMTPKSMLRVPTSRMDELVHGRFQEAIDDPHFEHHKGDRRQVARVVLCTGKFYHELAARRDALKRYDTALVRVEQFYPFHHELVKEILSRYSSKAQLCWAQEEARNMGAYLFVDDVFRNELGRSGLAYLGREASATPAVGSKHAHKDEQEGLLTKIIGPAPAKSTPGGPGAGQNGSHPAPSAPAPTTPAKAAGKVAGKK